MSIITSAIPAAVALVVVLIGGIQQKNRQRADAEAADKRWLSQTSFEWRKFTLQERRKLYADYLTTLDRMDYCIIHMLGHQFGQCEYHSTDEARQNYMQAHVRLEQLAIEIALIGSVEAYEITRKVASLIRDGELLDADRNGAYGWIGDGVDGDDDADPGPKWIAMNDLRLDLIAIARDELLEP